MQPNTPSTSQDRRRRFQRGQAMVLNAMTLIILFGMIGLAIDGGRLYWERRTLQNAVDAAALAASDNYQDSSSISAAITAAANEYAANERIYSTATVSGSGSNWQASWATSPDVMKVTYTSAGSVSSFAISSTHTVPLAFMLVLGAGSTATVATSATGHAKAGGTSTTAVLTLDTQTCTGGSKNSLDLSGGGSGGNFYVSGGDVHVDGSANLAGHFAYVQSGGQWYNNCPCPVPAGVIAASGTHCGAAPLADPGFAVGPTSYFTATQPAPGSTTMYLAPGIYNSNLAAGSLACYYLEPGLYTLKANMTATSDFFSNYLRPPDEPNWNTSVTPNAPDYTTLSSSPLWPSACKGSFTVSAQTDLLSLGVGSWGVVVTSTRTDAWPPVGFTGSTNYLRESFPSMCHSVTLAALQSLKVTINNLPGPTGYNVYAAYATAGNACTNGKWGYVTSVSNPNWATETPSALGSESVTINTSILGGFLPTPTNVTNACDFTSSTPYAIGCAAATGASGSANPPGDGGETAPETIGSTNTSDPPRDVVSQGGGDRANHADCRPRSTNPSAPCAGAILTPGAVQLYFQGTTTCLSLSSGFTLPIFSGYQYNWLAIYGDPTNSCSPSVSGTGGLRIKGGIYWPLGNWTISGNGLTSISSEIIVYTLAMGGNANLIFTYDVYSVPIQGYSQISA